MGPQALSPNPAHEAGSRHMLCWTVSRTPPGSSFSEHHSASRARLAMPESRQRTLRLTGCLRTSVRCAPPPWPTPLTRRCLPGSSPAWHARRKTSSLCRRSKDQFFRHAQPIAAPLPGNLLRLFRRDLRGSRLQKSGQRSASSQLRQNARACQASNWLRMPAF